MSVHAKRNVIVFVNPIRHVHKNLYIVGVYIRFRLAVAGNCKTLEYSSNGVDRFGIL